MISILYFNFTSHQLKYGLPSLTNVLFSLMRHTTTASSTLFLVYRRAPFIFELRTAVDWTFAKTSLD